MRSVGSGRGAQRAHGERQIHGNAAADAGEPRCVRNACARSTHLCTSGVDSTAFSSVRRK